MLVLRVNGVLKPGVSDTLSKPRVLISSSRSLFFLALSKSGVAALVYCSSVCYTTCITPFPLSFASISLNHFL
jgi:hypothetical protein